MNPFEKVHGGSVYPHRISRLTEAISPLLPPKARTLDVGCGDGLLASEVMRRRKDVQIEGIDLLVRRNTFIPVLQFDGERIPHPDASFDSVMFVDVLHHTNDPSILLREAKRVTRHYIIIKDHTRSGLMAGLTLRVMDWVGNARHGVALPYNYWARDKWSAEFRNLGLEINWWAGRLNLYPWWGNWAFGRSLHFVARLKRPSHDYKP